MLLRFAIFLASVTLVNAVWAQQWLTNVANIGSASPFPGWPTGTAKFYRLQWSQP